MIDMKMQLLKELMVYLKQEFDIDIDKYNYLNLNDKQKLTKQAIEIYNECRPHYSNFMLTQ